MAKLDALVSLAIGFCAFGVAWPFIRHFTGLAEEHGSALVLAILIGLVTGIGYFVLETRLFDILQRRGRR